ncbi:MAG TPA: hypothetical protein VHY35_04375 [Stellaceae bacterium]|jgi:DNA-binding NtrC family response regulator|nr:hypothetical protein [Stellaceae bacterium]
MTQVLLIEPDRHIRKLIAGILSDFGHEVRPCCGRCEAERVLSTSQVDVVVSDLVLDRRGGDFAAIARQVPVLTLAGMPYPIPRNVPDATARFCDKPFRVSEVKRLLAAVAELAPAQLLAA